MLRGMRLRFKNCWTRRKPVVPLQFRSCVITNGAVLVFLASEYEEADTMQLHTAPQHKE